MVRGGKALFTHNACPPYFIVWSNLAPRLSIDLSIVTATVSKVCILGSLFIHLIIIIQLSHQSFAIFFQIKPSQWIQVSLDSQCVMCDKESGKPENLLVKTVSNFITVLAHCEPKILQMCPKTQKSLDLMIISNSLYDNATFLKIVNEWICFITT